VNWVACVAVCLSVCVAVCHSVHLLPAAIMHSRTYTGPAATCHKPSLWLEWHRAWMKAIIMFFVVTAITKHCRRSIQASYNPYIAWLFRLNVPHGSPPAAGYGQYCRGLYRLRRTNIANETRRHIIIQCELFHTHLHSQRSTILITLCSNCQPISGERE